MKKDFYYHESWLPDPTDLVDPKLLVHEYLLGELTKKEFIQELVMLIVTYQDLKYSGTWSDRVFSQNMRELDKLIGRFNFSIWKLYN